MTQRIAEARAKAEALIGRKIDEREFQEALAYAEMKAKAQGNGRDYVPLLLPDVIRERIFQEATLEIARAKKDLEEAYSPWKHGCNTNDRIDRLRQNIPQCLSRYVSPADLRLLVTQTT